VSLANLKGDNLANALMKAETKAKRRVTLSIVWLGWLDETEVETVAGARPVQVSDNGDIDRLTQAQEPASAPIAAKGWTSPASQALINKLATTYGIDPNHLRNGLLLWGNKQAETLTPEEQIDIPRRARLAQAIEQSEMKPDEFKKQIALAFGLMGVSSVYTLTAEETKFLWDGLYGKMENVANWVTWLYSGDAKKEWENQGGQ
jgi:hypothetical protein